MRCCIILWAWVWPIKAIDHYREIVLYKIKIVVPLLANVDMVVIIYTIFCETCSNN